MQTIHAVLSDADVTAAVAQFVLQKRNFRFHDGGLEGPMIISKSLEGKMVQFSPMKVDIWVPTSEADADFEAVRKGAKPAS